MSFKIIFYILPKLFKIICFGIYIYMYVLLIFSG